MVLSQSTTRRTPRDGTVALLVAVVLSTLLGMVGFAVDGGMMLSEKRHAQSVADAAAMAGACILYQNFATDFAGNSYNQNSSSHSTARTEAVHVAALNGYQNDGHQANQSAVTVNFPPNIGAGWPTTITSIYNTSTQSPSYDGYLADGCIEVQVFYYMPRNFSSVWGSDLVRIAARAVAKATWSAPKNGVIVLNYDGKQDLSDKGGGAITVDGGSFIVNSNDPSAVLLTGGGTIVSQEFDVTGGISISGSGGTITTSPTPDQIFSGLHPTPDPLAYLPTPTQPADVTYTYDSATHTYTLPPGRYTSLPNFTNGDTVNFTGNGVYWFDTSFTSNGANINGSNLMFYQNSGTFSIAGSSSGVVNLSPMTTGIYQDLIMWQPKTNTNTVSLQGSGGMNIRGTFYAPGALLTLEGNNSGSTGNSFGSQFVTLNMKISGNGNIYVRYNGPDIAKSRVLCLVE